MTTTSGIKVETLDTLSPNCWILSYYFSVKSVKIAVSRLKVEQAWAWTQKARAKL